MNIDYANLSADELYYLVGQAAVWYLKKGGEVGQLEDLLADAEADAEADAQYGEDDEA